MNNKGVSAVVGVILMVAITAAITCIVYLFASNRLIDVDYPDYISGNLTSIQHINENKYLFTLDNDSYILTFDVLPLYTQYSFTIDNFYMLRIRYDTIDHNIYIEWVVEINAVQ